MQYRDLDKPSLDEPESNRPNKSALKREAQALVDLGIRLAELPPAQWEQLGLDETLIDALSLFNRIDAHGAKARQRALIGKLLRHRDVEPILAYLQKIELNKTLQTRDFHRIESWRDRLLEEGAQALDTLMSEAPNLPKSQIAHLIADAQQTHDAQKRTKLSRELFRLLREQL